MLSPCVCPCGDTFVCSSPFISVSPVLQFLLQLDYIHCWIDQCMLSKIKYRGFFNFNSFVNLTVYIAVIGLKFGPVSSRGNVHMNGSTCSEKSDAVIRMGSLSTMEALIKTLLNNV